MRQVKARIARNLMAVAAAVLAACSGVRASLTKPLNEHFDQRPHLARRKIAERTQNKRTSFRRS
jgi:hypothetical protein